ncbi:MAG: hypothetical protein ACXWQR_12360 [Ktedonobacterales bacterium]
MGIVRFRASAEIREQAIKTALNKYDEGCDGCAVGYLQLAREHGATSAEIARAGATSSLSRRGFVRFAALALAAGAAVATGNLLTTGTARAMPGQFASLQGSRSIVGYFGVDGCTTPAAGSAEAMPLQFYIAELGATNYGINCFNKHTSAYVGDVFTHGYWGVSGPNLTEGDPFAYGQQQAQAALDAWKNTPGVGGYTIFADIEAGFDGWGDPATPAQNAALLDGFLTTIAQANFVPGVYINNNNRDHWFPSDYVPAVPFVYWVAGGPYANSMCAPCAKDCDTLTPVAQYWQDAVGNETFAGQAAVIWQYWLSGAGCSGDFNYSPQTGYQAFTPLKLDATTAP